MHARLKQPVQLQRSLLPGHLQIGQQGALAVGQLRLGRMRIALRDGLQQRLEVGTRSGQRLSMLSQRERKAGEPAIKAWL